MRLVVHDDRAVRDGLVQRAREGEMCIGAWVVRGVVPRHAATGALGLVHRDIGAVQQGGSFSTVVGRDGHADARIELDAGGADGNRSCQRAPNRRRPGVCVLGVAHAG